jgi:hypothetical protein
MFLATDDRVGSCQSQWVGSGPQAAIGIYTDFACSRKRLLNSFRMAVARPLGGVRASRAEMAADQIGRNDAADHLMAALARLAFDLTSLGRPSTNRSMCAVVASMRRR